MSVIEKWQILGVQQGTYVVYMYVYSTLINICIT